MGEIKAHPFGPFAASKRFELLRTIGRGGMGVVYEAFDRRRGVVVALKTLRDVDPDRLFRLKEEFRTVADLSHPNLVTLHELVSEDGQFGISMELVDGTDFVSFVRPRGSLGRAEPDSASASRDMPTVVDGPQTGAMRFVQPATPVEMHAFEEIVDALALRRALAELVDALVALHRHGVVHHDLKPSNVLVTPTGRVVLLDFGVVARLQGAAGLPTRFMGTPTYAAPEQLMGLEPSSASDWYALGVLLYEVLTDRVPFVGTVDEIRLAKTSAPVPPPGLFTWGVPADLERLCMGLLRRLPQERPSVAEIVAIVGRPSCERPTAVESDDGIGDVFVGRRAELARLHEAWSRVSSKPRAVVIVEASSGMGKSTLVRRFVDELGGTDPTVWCLAGRCHERETLPYNGFDRIVDALRQTLTERQGEARSAWLPAEAWRLARIFPVLADLVGAPPDPEAHREPVAVARARAFETFAELLGLVSRERPVLLWIDDLQWSDRETLDLLLVLVGAGTKLGNTMIVLSRRSDPSPIDEVLERLRMLADRKRCVPIRLAAFDAAEQAELITRLTDDEAAGERFGSAWRACHGIPLFLSELAQLSRAQRDAGLPIRGLDFADVVARRLERETPEVQRLAEWVVCASGPIPAPLVGRLAELDASTREQAIHALRVGRFVKVTRPGADPWIDVYHDRLREVLLERIPADERIAMHARLAAALAEHPGIGPERLAMHWMGADEPRRAAELYRRAALRARAKLAFDHEAELWKAALDAGGYDPPTQAELLSARGDALVFAGRSFDAAGAYRSAALLLDGDARAELERRAGVQLLRSGHPVEGLSALSEAFASMGITLPRNMGAAMLRFSVARTRLVVRGLAWTARDRSKISPAEVERLDLLSSTSNYVGVIDHMAAAAVQTDHLRACLDAGDPVRVARALAIEATYQAMQGRATPRSQALLDEASEVAARIDDVSLRGLVRMSEGACHVFSMRLQQAADLCEEAERCFRRADTTLEWEKISSYSLSLIARVYMGQFDRVAERVEALLEEARIESDAYARNILTSEPNVWRLLRMDALDEARESVRQCIEGWPADKFWLAHYRHAIANLLVLLYAGRPDAAVAEGDRAIAGMRRSLLLGVPLVRGHVGVYYGSAAIQAGSKSQVRRALKLLRSCGLPTFAGYADVLEAVFEHRARRTKPNLDALRPKVAMLRELEHFVGLPAAFALGHLVEGREGAAIRDEACGALHDIGVAAPRKVLEAFAGTSW